MRTGTILLLMLLMAGCTGSTGGDDQSATSTSTSASSSTSCPPGCGDPPDTHSMRLNVYAGGPGEVGVPFPHGDSCIQPDEWTLLHASALNATGELRSVDRGTVLWVAFTGPGGFTATIDLRDRATCQTFRYDPWSIDPDAADGTIDLLAPGAFNVTVDISEWHGYAGDGMVYRGALAAGWNNVPGQHYAVVE